MRISRVLICSFMLLWVAQGFAFQQFEAFDTAPSVGTADGQWRLEDDLCEFSWIDNGASAGYMDVIFDKRGDPDDDGENYLGEEDIFARKLDIDPVTTLPAILTVGGVGADPDYRIYLECDVKVTGGIQVGGMGYVGLARYYTEPNSTNYENTLQHRVYWHVMAKARQLPLVFLQRRLTDKPYQQAEMQILEH